MNSTGDGTSGSGTSGTLPYVISQANADPNPAGSEISFDATVFSTPQTIDLEATLVLSETSGPEVIDGPEAGSLSISGEGSTVFQVQNGVTATISGLTITGGYAKTLYRDEGGGGLLIYGTANLIGCTISGNSAKYNGGGIFNAGTATLDDCTISGNSSDYGGAIYDDGTLNLTACTVSGNSAVQVNEGLIVIYGQVMEVMGSGASATLTDTIVAGNHADAEIAYSNTSNVTGTYNLIGSETPAFANGVDGNIVLTGSDDPVLAPLGNYGGPTQTMPILPGSPALGAGTAVAGITTDQRGDPLDSTPDIGAFQSHGFTIATVAGTTPQQTTDGIPFANPLAVVVTANDPSEPVAGGVVTYTESSPGNQAALSAGTATIGADGSASVIACSDSVAESYTVSAGIPGVAPVTFSLTNVASTPVFDYTVDSADGGIAGSGISGTLAYVQFLANADEAPHTEETVISFDPTVFSTAQTITLDATSTLSETSSPEAIDGPGADLLTVSVGDAATVFQEESGVTATLSGMTFAGAAGALAPSGQSDPALLMIYGTATTLDDCTIGGNSGSRGWGITIPDDTLTVTLDGCTIDDNAEGGIANGIDNTGGTVTLTDCTITGNIGYRPSVPSHLDEGQYSSGLQNLGTATLIACTITGNNDGIENDGSGQLTLTDTIVADNPVNGAGVDIGGGYPSHVTGSYNLIGISGSGGITNGVDGNIVLTSLDDLDLGPLADNGGPTPTQALMPGSAAINAGTAVPGVATDQRGLPLDSPPDIGAYQLQDDSVQVASISAVTPGVRDTPVSSIDVTLSRDVGPDGFSAAALTLTDDGGPNLINGAVTVTQLSGTMYAIGGLSSLTAADGTYTLTINAAEFLNADGLGVGSQLTSWLMDTTPPTSTVEALPSQTASTSFVVSVTASDPSAADGGRSTGVASIAIYDSTDGGPFVLFTTVTPANPSATFTGQAGDTYAFYSVATDAAGNVQPTPAAQATTTLIDPQSTPAVIVGQQPVFHRKLNKKGHPVGKAVLSGFTLDFASPLNPADATDPAHYRVDTITNRKVKKRVEHILRPITGFTVSLSTAGDAVTIALAKPLAFTTGGQITVLPGVTGASGGPLEGNTVFAISRRGASVEPG